MDDKKKQKIFNKVMTRIFLALLIGFSALYISEATGYYEFEQHKKVTLTEEKIEQFENDVASGKDINIKDYLDEKEINYQNNLSNAGNHLSEQIENIISNGLESTFNFLGQMFQGKWWN